MTSPLKYPVIIAHLVSSKAVSYCHSSVALPWSFAPAAETLVFFLKSSLENIFFIASRLRRREREKHQCQREAPIGCFPCVPRPRIVHTQTRDWTHSLGMCPDREPNSNVYRSIHQPTEPYRPGQNLDIFELFSFIPLPISDCFAKLYFPVLWETILPASCLIPNSRFNGITSSFKLGLNPLSPLKRKPRVSAHVPRVFWGSYMSASHSGYYSPPLMNCQSPS